MSEPLSQEVRADLLALCRASYALSEADIAHLARAIGDAYLAARAAAYRDWAVVARARSELHYTPSKAEVAAARTWADEQAAGIAQTYQEMLEQQVRAYLESVSTSSFSTWELGALVSLLIIRLRQWVADLLGWKPRQIAGATGATGSEDATTLFVKRVLDGIVEVPEEVELGVTILPAESSGDLCRQYAGRIYTLEESLAVPAFPAHPNCIHDKVIIDLAET